MQQESQFYLNLIVITFAVLFVILGGVFYFGSRKKKQLNSLDKPDSIGPSTATKNNDLHFSEQKTKAEADSDKSSLDQKLSAKSGDEKLKEINLKSSENLIKLQTSTSESLASEKTLKQALSQTEKVIFGRIKNLFVSNQELQNFDDLEEILYTSDLGPMTVDRLLNKVKDNLSRSDKKNLETIKSALKEEFKSILKNSESLPSNLNSEPAITTFAESSSIKTTDSMDRINQLKLESNNHQDNLNNISILNPPFVLEKLKWKPEKEVTVWMIVGVNGAGKTTSIGKLAFLAASQGKKVMVAAGDTFRAAAGAQLKVWSDRAQVEIYSPENTKDPAAVAYEALVKCKNQQFDLLIVDTAGRLHTQVPLMEELKKVKRVMSKVDEKSPDETLIVLDANSGQNALMQAKEFHKSVGLTGVIVTKMDGTAKGGVVIGVANELGLPIRLVGVGEKISDLRRFSSDEFIESILNG